MIKRYLLWGFIGIIIAYSLFSLYKLDTTSTPDFLVYYSAASNMLHNASLYIPHHSFTLFAYPPITALFFTPFSLLPYQLSQDIFALCNYLAIFLCVFCCFTILSIKPSRETFLLTVSLALLSFPVKFTFGMGQSNLIAYSFVLVSILCANRKLATLAGLALATGCIIKPILAFFLLYYLLKKEWKVIGSFIGLGMLFLITEFLLSPHALIDWQTYLFKILPSLFTTAGREVYYNQGIMGFLSRLSVHMLFRKWGSLIISSILFLLTIWKIIKTPKDNTYHIALLFSLLPLIDTLSWQHHFVFLLFPMMFAWFSFKKTRMFLAGFILSYLLLSSNIKTPQQFIHFPFSLILSNTFYGGFLLFLLLILRQRLKISLRGRETK